MHSYHSIGKDYSIMYTHIVHACTHTLLYVHKHIKTHVHTHTHTHTKMSITKVFVLFVY